MANRLTPSSLQPAGLAASASSRDIRRQLAQGALDVQRRLHAGCPPPEFEQWRCIAAAIASAIQTLALADANNREPSRPTIQGE